MQTLTSRTTSLLTALAVVSAGTVIVLSAPAAQAATNDQGLSGVRSNMWQTNQLVRTLAVSNGVVYAGGDFTAVRPPGAASGTNQTSRSYLAAFNASTGALVTSFNVTLNGRVYDTAVSSDGSRLYIAGSFTTVNGTARQRVAAINIPSGTLATGFTANANSAATAIAVSPTAVYVGGDFTTIGGQSKARFASLNATTGAVNTGFTANLDARPSVVAVPPDASRVLVGGAFTTVNGAAPSGIASLNPTTGATLPWAANSVQPINASCGGRTTDIIFRGTTTYVTAEGDPPGCYEGTYAANTSDGAMLWNSSCLGASLGLAIIDDVLYKASHQHDCGFTPGGASGGFVGATSRDGFIWRRLVGQNLSDGTFVHWYPNTNGAGSTHVGPHTLATDGSQLFVGGDFTSVDGQAQQGLARYGRGNNAAPNTPAAPKVQATGSQTLTVTWPAVIDRDSGTLTYRLYRDGASTPVYTTTVESYPWTLPWMRFDDTGLAAGSSHTYRLRVSDGTLTGSQSAAGSGTVRTSAPASFASTVQSSSPNLFWRLNGGGTNLADSSSGGANPGTSFGGVTTGVAGAVGSNSAVRLNGSTGYLASNSPLTLGATFTESAWFRTTSIYGGVIAAMSTSQTGPGGTTDRMITMDNNGNIVLGVKGQGSGGPFGPRLTVVRVQDNSFSDGRWHQVVGTYDGTTLSLYVDGQLLGATVGSAAGMTSGYQRVGYANLSTMQAVFGINFFNLKWPLSEYFDGDVDEVASYNTVLSAAQVAAQFAAAVGEGSSSPGDTTPPSAPTNLSSSNVTSSGATISWNASTDDTGVTGYQVLRNGTAVSGWVTGTSFTDSGLSASTTYTYTVVARDAANNVSSPSSGLPVTTSSGGGSSTLFTDAFTGSSGAWGSSWTTGSSNGSVALAGNAGRLAFNDVSGAYARAQLTGVAARSDAGALFSYQFDSTAARSWVDIGLRGSGTWQNGYRLRNGYYLEINSTSGTVSIARNVNGTTASIGSLAGGNTVSTGKQWVRYEVVGSTIRVKTWLDGQSEPSAWEASVTDGNVTAAGQLFLSLNRASVNTGAKALSVDDLTYYAAS